MSRAKTFGLADYLVLGGATACSLLAGLYYAYKERKQYSAYRFHRGGGKLKPIPVALSLLVTFESSIFFLGVPAEIYINGSMFWLNIFAMGIGFSGMFWITIPLFYPLQITSVYEYLQRRHGSEFIRQLATALSTLFMVLYSGIVLFGAGIALEAVTNIPKEGSMIGMVLLAVVYTSLGGMKAVVVTDAIQGLVMIAAIVAVLVYGTMQAGGISNVIALNEASGRLKLIDFDPNPLTRHTFWTLVVGGCFRSIGFCFAQPVMQRLNSTRSQSDAKTVAAIAVPGFIFLDLLVVMEGLVAYAYFSNKGCDPLASGQISNPNQIMSYTVLDMFAGVPGVPGLFLAAICSATLSTVSSLLSSVSAIVSEDFIKTHCKTITDKTLTRYSKIIVPITGVISVSIAVVIGSVKGPITQIAGSILGAINSPLSCIFLMSIFVKFSTKKGLLAGTAVGIVLALWISLGYNFSQGRKQTPWLPLGPTDRCDIPGNASSSSVDIFETANVSNTAYNISQISATPNFSIGVTDEEAAAIPTPLHGLDYLYSISYLYFPGIVLIVSILTATIVSKCTQPVKPRPIPPELMLACSSRVCGSSGDRGYSAEDIEIEANGQSRANEMAKPLSTNTDTL